MVSRLGGFSVCMKHERFTADQRNDIREGLLKVDPEEVMDIVRRPILAELDRIVTVLVKAAAFGHGKFANRGQAVEEEDGHIDFVEEHIPIQQRLKLGLDLIKFVTGRDVPNADAGLDQEEFLKRLKSDGKIQSGTAGEHTGGTGQETS